MTTIWFRDILESTMKLYSRRNLLAVAGLILCGLSRLQFVLMSDMKAKDSYEEPGE
jgi:hypothetical protein